MLGLLPTQCHDHGLRRPCNRPPDQPRAGTGVPADRSPGSRLTQIAEAAQVSKQAAKFLVDQLERSGYVERVADPHDGRARMVRITPHGYDVIRIATDEQTKIEGEWVAHLGHAATEELRRVLLQLREITDPYY